MHISFKKKGISYYFHLDYNKHSTIVPLFFLLLVIVGDFSLLFAMLSWWFSASDAYSFLTTIVRVLVMWLDVGDKDSKIKNKKINFNAKWIFQKNYLCYRTFIICLIKLP